MACAQYKRALQHHHWTLQVYLDTFDTHDMKQVYIVVVFDIRYIVCIGLYTKSKWKEVGQRGGGGGVKTTYGC